MRSIGLGVVSFFLLVVPATSFAQQVPATVGDPGDLGAPARTFTKLDLTVETHDATQGTGTTHVTVTKDGKVAIDYRNLPGDTGNATFSYQLTPAELDALQKTYAAADATRNAKPAVVTPIEFQLDASDDEGGRKASGSISEFPGLKALLGKVVRVPKDRVDEKKDRTKGDVNLSVSKDAPKGQEWRLDMKVAPDGTITGTYKGFPGLADGRINAKLSPERLAALRSEIVKADFTQVPASATTPADAIQFKLGTNDGGQGRWVEGPVASYPRAMQEIVKDLSKVAECASPALDSAIDHPVCTGITRALDEKLGK
jgi:hypothetical protein